MPIYVVLSPPEQVGESLEEQVKAGYTENDRHEIMPGAWFIRSPLITTDQVRENLDVKVGGNSGIVVAAGRYTGVADRALVEKLQVWEEGTE